jgi:hypothetical protein
MNRKLTSSASAADSDHRTLRREARFEWIEERGTRVNYILPGLERVLGEWVSGKRLIGLGDVHGRHVGAMGALDGDDVQRMDHESTRKTERM